MFSRRYINFFGLDAQCWIRRALSCDVQHPWLLVQRLNRSTLQHNVFYFVHKPIWRHCRPHSNSSRSRGSHETLTELSSLSTSLTSVSIDWSGSSSFRHKITKQLVYHLSRYENNVMPRNSMSLVTLRLFGNNDISTLYCGNGGGSCPWPKMASHGPSH